MPNGLVRAGSACRRSMSRKFVASAAVAGGLLLAQQQLASATTNYFGQSDTFYAYQYHMTMPVPGANGGSQLWVADPNSEFALYHLFFNVGQPSSTNGRNMVTPTTAPAFVETGLNFGDLPGNNGLSFYYAECVDAQNPATCNMDTEYVQQPISSVPVVKGDTYEYGVDYETTGYGAYYWHLYMRNDTTATNYNAAYIMSTSFPVCCSSAAVFGSETSARNWNDVYLPGINGTALAYVPNGQPSGDFFNFPGSSIYPPSGGGPCQAGDALADTTIAPCTEPLHGKLYASYNTKYNSVHTGSN